MGAPPLDNEPSQSSSGYEDGLGRRTLAFDRETGGMLERLLLRPELCAFEQALNERIAIVAALEDERFARPRGIERDADDRLIVVSEYLAGRRLSDIIEAAAEHGIVAGIDAGLGLLLEILPAVARLHDAGLVHGVLGPGRVMITPASQIALLDSIYGEPLERLQLTRKRLWSEFRLAFPPTAGMARFDKAADLGHASMIAANLIVGRVLQDSDYPEGISILRQEILEIASIRGSKAFADAVDKFFAATLPLAGRRGHGMSADEAAIELRKLVRKELGINSCRTALLEFLQQVETAEAERAAAEAAELEQRAPADNARIAAEEAARAAQAEAARREAERQQRERAEQAKREAARLEQDRAEAKRREHERAEAERQERERLEAERLERERAEQARLEAERIERERLEAERRERERLEAERQGRERQEAERLERERAEQARLEAERIERERLEAERKERERLEAERQERERQEAERLERERAEQARLEVERIERERLDAERKERERLEAERLEAERLERERVEQARLEAERIERERLEAERKERERLEAERRERERLEAERLERERIEKARLEAERIERERLEAERKERERLEAERKERERQEAERLERERLERERIEKARQEAERKERERIEAERVERERAERARLEAERRERERAEAEQRERERVEQARLAAETLERERREAERTAEEARRKAERLEREQREAEERERQRVEAERRERERIEREHAEADRAEKERAARAASVTAGGDASESSPPPLSALEPPAAAAPPSNWLIPPGRAATFEPPVPHDSPPPAPTPLIPTPAAAAAARPYPIYVPPAEPAAWTVDLQPAETPAAEIVSPIAAAKPKIQGASAPIRVAPPAAVQGGIRLKGDFDAPPSAAARSESRGEPASDDISAAGAYDPYSTTEPRHPIPWKLIAAGVVVIAGTFAISRGYTPAAAPVVETVRKVIPKPAPAVAPIAANVGRLTITTQPPGAKVVVDGKPAGETPLTLDGVKPGRHTVSLTSAEGAAKRTVRVEAGQALALDVALYSGFVAISMPFVVNVAEGGKAIGTSEQQILLSPGKHDLRLSNKDLGYSETKSVEVQSGEVARLDLDPRGSANINAAPWAEVWIDGEKAGETPMANVPIRLGVREIVFKNPQYPDRKQTVTITASSVATISVDFIK